MPTSSAGACAIPFLGGWFGAKATVMRVEASSSVDDSARVYRKFCVRGRVDHHALTNLSYDQSAEIELPNGLRLRVSARLISEMAPA